LVPGVFGNRETMSFFKTSLRTLLSGRLISRHWFWIISAESSQAFIHRSNSGLVLCSFPCSAALLLCCPLSSLPSPCNLFCCFFFASPFLLPNHWLGRMQVPPLCNFASSFLIYPVAGGRCPTVFVQKK
jgi:hypothetical protein